MLISVASSPTRDGRFMAVATQYNQKLRGRVEGTPLTIQEVMTINANESKAIADAKLSLIIKALATTDRYLCTTSYHRLTL